MRLPALLASIFLCGGIAPGQDPPPGGETRTVAIVEDGESWYFEEMTAAVVAELEKLAGGLYELKIERHPGNYNGDAIEQQLLDVIAAPDVDVVYAAGVMATERALRLEESQRTKPVMGGALQFTEQTGNLSETMCSTVPNYTFLTSPRRVHSDLRLLKSLTGATQLHALVDGVFLPELVRADGARERFVEELGVEIDFVAGTGSVESTLSAVPAGVKNLYVAIQPRLDDGERRRLYAGLAKRGIRTVSMHGVRDVRLGAMAGLAPDNDETVARSIAVNLHQLLTGAGTADLVVSLPVSDRLVVNAGTGRQVGWSPDYETVLQGEVINDLRSRGGEPLGLTAAMERAANENADVLSEREAVVIANRDVGIARSRLFPQVSLEASHGGTQFSDRTNPLLTPRRAHQGSYGLQLRQVLFSDELWSGLKARKWTAESARLEYLSQRLDATEAAAAAYFDLLTAQALYRIEKENLDLTENNLEMARLRVAIGAAIPAEVYRWEQGRARSKAAVFQRDAAREDARVALNRLIGAPRDVVWTLDDLTVGDDEFYFLGDGLNEIISNAAEFRKFGAFVQQEAVMNSPELAGFRSALAAQGIVLRQLKRRYYVPEVSGSLAIDRAISGSTTTDTDGQNEATAGIVFSLPLFEGGGRREEVRRQEAVIRQLERQQDSAIQSIEQRVLVAFHGISASHPSIRLSRAGLQAAEQNYESVKQRYLRNAVTQLDVLDAQSTLVQQKQETAVAVYTYLGDIHALQRGLAWFEHDKSDDEKRAFLERLQRFVDGQSPGSRSRAADIEPGEPGGSEAERKPAPPERRRAFPWTRKR